MNGPRDNVDDIQEEWLRERPDTPVGSIGVVTRIWRIAKLLADDRRRTMTRLGVDTATRDLLAILRRSGPPYALTPGELARRAAVSPGAISQRVARAESHGLVRRQKNDDDGRGVVVILTDNGHELIERTVDDLLSHEEQLLSGLTDKQRRELSDLLRILLADLTERTSLTERTPNPDSATELA
ncbi:MarR family transcriptional regulator [Actinobacteria bacterium YIM 96077]|uniref:MarR family transcriptional regulator n=1 Tax=Phytoactinopolyspora halophila TaxID=1981511 RepID=A0A329R2V7_9ACTN|nr:MarR family transcriptional regulator [Phytoactinopolyspora halophila]AYY11734.1 MarR family transcriptional regulator [Actinobacteria bacterium YIM 96077]RAW17832.1 MarR family transcriptional regulator [Phytoactinopolyspora halophila]